MKPDSLRVVAFQDGNKWIAQCLEVDVCVQADDLETLRNRMALALQLTREESLRLTGSAFAGINPAPEQYQDMWNERTYDGRMSGQVDGHKINFGIAA